MSGIETAFSGALWRDAERKTSQGGKPYLRLNLRVGDNDEAQWVSVLAFDESALEVADKLVKGARVYCEGRLSLNEWTNADGVVKLSLSVMSFHTRLAQIGKNKPKRNNVSVAGGGQAYPPRSAGNDFHNDEIPFAADTR